MALALEAVSLALGGQPVLRTVSFALPKGRLVALVGPNGAGKTSLLRAIAGLVEISGTVIAAGERIDTLPRMRRARAIAYLPQGHQVHWPLSARDVVALGRFPHGLVDPADLPPDHAAIIAAAMARTGTTALAGRAIHSLSGGERARVMLARVLAVEAPILLADEPTTALDPHHQLAVMEGLRAEARHGTLVIAATHDLGLAARLADEVILLAEGQVAAIGPPSAVFTPERLAAHYRITAITQEIAGERLLVPWARVP
jgi:iron complex transport system ATP-binding protein